MSLHPSAGKKASEDMLVDVDKLIAAYYSESVDLAPVSFGTSGHRGSSFKKSFNESHILATTQAICDYRKHEGIRGPLYIGFDSHALSKPAFETAVSVLAANDVEARYQECFSVTSTPAISHAILTYNARHDDQADGIVITPSHNPPEDGGFKYNATDGGPANTNITTWVQNRANSIIVEDLRKVKKMDYKDALEAPCLFPHDFISAYVKDLENVIDIQAIKDAGVKIGVDPLGGAGLPFWNAIKEHYDLDLTVVNQELDPTFSFMRQHYLASVTLQYNPVWN